MCGGIQGTSWSHQDCWCGQQDVVGDKFVQYQQMARYPRLGSPSAPVINPSSHHFHHIPSPSFNSTRKTLSLNSSRYSASHPTTGIPSTHFHPRRPPPSRSNLPQRPRRRIRILSFTSFPTKSPPHPP